MKNGAVDTVVLLGTNPTFTAQNIDFAGAISNVNEVIHLSDYVDETSKSASWHINKSFYLESWGDGHSYGGVRSVIQPQIQPLYNGISDIEALNIIVNGEMKSGYDLVQSTFKNIYGAGFKSKWATLLHDGVDTNSGFTKANVRLASNFRPDTSRDKAISGIEITVKADSTLHDGRFANIAWLQELPDPMTKITWDNVAAMNPATAKDLCVEHERCARNHL